MHQDATWYGDRPQPRGLCVRWGDNPLPTTVRSPQFFAHVYCDRTAAWFKMPLGTEVGLGPDDIVLDGDPAPIPQNGDGSIPSPIFGPCLLWLNGWMAQDGTWHVDGLGPGHIVLDWGPAPLPKKGAEPPIFGPFLLRPNGWMHQDATWYGGRPQPRRLCVRWDPDSLPKNGRSPQIFGPRLLWPNGYMDQDATWYGGRPRLRRHCVRWGPSSSSPRGAHPAPHFSANVRCGQTAKMALGIEVGLGRQATLCSIGTQLPPEKKDTPTTQFLAHVYCA